MLGRTARLVSNANGTTTVTYETVAGQQFTVTLDANDMVTKMKGEGLNKKVPGTRGYTARSGRKATNMNMNASHLIGDLFMGSGYKSSCNLITTSDQYNQGDMAREERKIAEWLDDVAEELDEDQWVLTDFTMELDVQWGAFDDARGVQAICKVLGITDPEILAEAQGIVSAWFTNHPALSKNLQRVMRIDYKVTAHNTSPDFESSMKTFTGVDAWLAIT